MDYNQIITAALAELGIGQEEAAVVIVDIEKKRVTVLNHDYAKFSTPFAAELELLKRVKAVRRGK